MTTRTAEDLSREVEQLRAMRLRYDKAVSNARQAYRDQQNLSPDKYSEGYVRGAREGAEAVHAALMAGLR